MLPHIDVPVTELVRAEELLAPPPSPEPTMEKDLTKQIEEAAKPETSKWDDEETFDAMTKGEKE